MPQTRTEKSFVDCMEQWDQSGSLPYRKNIKILVRTCRIVDLQRPYDTINVLGMIEVIHNLLVERYPTKGFDGRHAKIRAMLNWNLNQFSGYNICLNCQ